MGWVMGIHDRRVTRGKKLGDEVREAGNDALVSQYSAHKVGSLAIIIPTNKLNWTNFFAKTLPGVRVHHGSHHG